MRCVVCDEYYDVIAGSRVKPSRMYTKCGDKIEAVSGMCVDCSTIFWYSWVICPTCGERFDDHDQPLDIIDMKATITIARILIKDPVDQLRPKQFYRICKAMCGRCD